MSNISSIPFPLWNGRKILVSYPGYTNFYLRNREDRRTTLTRGEEKEPPLHSTLYPAFRRQPFPRLRRSAISFQLFDNSTSEGKGFFGRNVFDRFETRRKFGIEWLESKWKLIIKYACDGSSSIFNNRLKRFATKYPKRVR